jgi:hypothetical protein
VALPLRVFRHKKNDYDLIYTKPLSSIILVPSFVLLLMLIV